jgi:glycosyltransferase involved in cell wall biosynthesis
VKILLDNVNLDSASGPNSFGKKLRHELINQGHEVDLSIADPEAQLSFITCTQKRAPLALRLDGIYFNTRQDWEQQNKPIFDSYKKSDLVIYQTSFNKMLTESYFGPSKKHLIIGNGTSQSLIDKIEPLKHPVLDRFSEVWTCSSSWRPHKRLKDNIEYFFQKAPQDSCLVIAGENPDIRMQHDRLLYAGQLQWETCIALYKRAKVFLHLAFLDHCPNVVVDARACGCDIIVSSSGGTKEIAGKNATIVKDIEWDFSPLDLYSPPPLNYDIVFNNELDSSIDMSDVAQKYYNGLLGII